jgi:hypothetical protein
VALTVSETTMCERDDWSLSPVDEVTRFLLPASMIFLACEAVWICSEVRSLTYMPCHVACAAQGW